MLDRRSDVDLLSCDVYVNVAGGVRVAEPAADLAVALALASSRLDLPLPADVAACGEIGLGGEVRRVSQPDLRLREAAKLGFAKALVPALGKTGKGGAPKGIAIETREIAHLHELVAMLAAGSKRK